MKKILIIGGTGSWGQELSRQILAQSDVEEIRIYSRGEHKQVEMSRKFNDGRLKFIIGDIRDSKALTHASTGVDHVFHLAALKHVPVCEHNPEETVNTNISGTINAIDASINNCVKTFVLVSTDKAVDPINVYGVSKSMAEKLVVNANMRNSKTKFVCIRGGNVLGTNGSVVPLFRNQIREVNTVTITDPTMTRFLMSLNEAIGLIFEAVRRARGGEIFVMKMPSINILDLADTMISQLGNTETTKKVIGIRPGEKIHEVLVSRYEAPRTFNSGKYFVILPNFNMNNLYEMHENEVFLNDEYNSLVNSYLSKEQLIDLLNSEGWLNGYVEDGLRQYSKEQLLEYFKREGWIR